MRKYPNEGVVAVGLRLKYELIVNEGVDGVTPSTGFVKPLTEGYKG